ncbi:MAG: diacylglycerol kinase family lipid kinase [Desulfobacterales bacterium]|nr:diacylglycerol kinase family lipid kinase [Desulfobacterales bacterium]
MRTLIIINPHSAGGRAQRIFKKIEGRLFDAFGELLIAVTQRPQEVAGHLDTAVKADVSRLITIGGDGTNHVVLNALAERSDLKVAFGSIPLGTGHDWSRSLGVPEDPYEAVDWLAHARPVPCDLGKVEYLNMQTGGKPSRRIFLNIASAGVSGEVDHRVNRARRRSSLTFLRATIATLMKYRPQRISILCDDKEFYSGSCYLVAVANGQYFGRGMWIAPKALINDGMFDVVAVVGMSRLRILLAFKSVYSGTHLEREDVKHTRAASVLVCSEDGPLKLDFDGEEAFGQELRFTVMPEAVNVLLDPSTAAIRRDVT